MIFSTLPSQQPFVYTWATKPSAAGNAGLEIIVSDLGNSEWKSDNKNWRSLAVVPGAYNIVSDGDSMSDDTYPTSYPFTAVAHFLRHTLGQIGDYRSEAIGGATAANLASSAATRVDTLLNANKSNLLIFWAGTNDLYSGATAQATKDAILAYCNARKAAGWTILVCTILPRTAAGTPPTFEADRTDVNNWIAANYSTFADYFCDLRPVTELNTVSSRYYYDLTHLSEEGSVFAAERIIKAVSEHTGQLVFGSLAGYSRLLFGSGANIGIGEQTLKSLTTGGNNIAIGSGVGSALTTASNNVAIGTDSLKAATGANNCVVGVNAGRSLTTGATNVCIGANAAYGPALVTANASTTGANNTYVGNECGQGSPTQRSNAVALGHRALVDGATPTALGSLANCAHDNAVAQIGRAHV